MVYFFLSMALKYLTELVYNISSKFIFFKGFITSMNNSGLWESSWIS